VSIALEALRVVGKCVPVSKTSAFGQTPAASRGDLTYCGMVQENGVRRRSSTGSAVGFVRARGADGCETHRDEDMMA
jgi:hypothetical protein